MSDAAARLRARRNAASQEKETRVYGSRDSWIMGGINSVSPNRYLVRLVEGNIFELKSKALSNKITCEIVAVLANGYDPDQKFDEKVKYGEPNSVGERACLIAGQDASDEMTLKNIKEIVAAVRNVDARKVGGLASPYIIYDKDTIDLVLQAASDGDSASLQAFPAFSYAVIFANDGSLPNPSEESEDDVVAAAIDAGILPKKAGVSDKADFLAQVGDLCGALPTGLDYAERWKHSYMIVEASVRENKARTGYYSSNAYRAASDTLLKQNLSPDAYAAYVAYKQIG
jgi:hypothetical protein